MYSSKFWEIREYHSSQVLLYSSSCFSISIFDFWCSVHKYRMPILNHLPTHGSTVYKPRRILFIPLDGPSHPLTYDLPKSRIIVEGTDEGWDFVPASFDEKSHLTAYDVTHPRRTHPQTTTSIYVRVVLVHCDKLQHAEEVFAKSFLIKSYHRRDEDLPLHFAKLLVELS